MKKKKKPVKDSKKTPTTRATKEQSSKRTAAASSKSKPPAKKAAKPVASKAATKEEIAGKIYDLNKELGNPVPATREHAIKITAKGFTKKDLENIHEALLQKVTELALLSVPKKKQTKESSPTQLTYEQREQRREKRTRDSIEWCENELKRLKNMKQTSLVKANIKDLNKRLNELKEK